MSVLMFHSVGCEKEQWYRKWLSVSLEHFETFCQFLAKNDYETIFFEEWYSSVKQQKKKDAKQVVLTFDDGYLDNWVYAYPILKKYGLKGTIFVNPEFIDDSSELRNNLFDVWEKRIPKSELKPLGFLNLPELKHMQDSGIIDIQSHSMSHNFYFRSDNIKDIYHGQAQYDWLAWIEKPNRKAYYPTEDQTGFVKFGFPIFEFGRALSLRRYFPDDRLVNNAVELFKSNREASVVLAYIKDQLNNFPGTYESDEAMEKRYRYELFESKRILEENLNKAVDFLCWPGGGYNDHAIKLSIEAGYKASTISRKDFSANTFPGSYQQISRYAMGSFISTAKNYHYVNNSNFLISLFKGFEGDALNKNLYYLRKLGFMAKDKISS